MPTSYLDGLFGTEEKTKPQGHEGQFLDALFNYQDNVVEELEPKQAVPIEYIEPEPGTEQIVQPADRSIVDRILRKRRVARRMKQEQEIMTYKDLVNKFGEERGKELYIATRGREPWMEAVYSGATGSEPTIVLNELMSERSQKIAHFAGFLLGATPVSFLAGGPAAKLALKLGEKVVSSTKLLSIMTRAAGGAATLGGKTIMDTAVQIKEGVPVTAWDATKNILASAGYGTAFGAVGGAISSPFARIPAEMATGYAAVKLQGGDNEDAMFLALTFGALGMLNTKNLRPIEREFAFRRMRTQFEEFARKNYEIPKEKIGDFAAKAENMLRAETADKVTIQRIDKLINSMKSDWRKILSEELPPPKPEPARKPGRGFVTKPAPEEPVTPKPEPEVKPTELPELINPEEQLTHKKGWTEFIRARVHPETYKPSFERVSGKPVTVEGYEDVEFFAYPADEGKGYYVIEKSTGLSGGGGKTIKEATESIIKSIDNIGREKFDKIISEKPKVPTIEPKREIPTVKHDLVRREEKPAPPAERLKKRLAEVKEEPELPTEGDFFRMVTDAILTHKKFLNRGSETNLVLEAGMEEGIIDGKQAKQVLDKIRDLEHQGKLGLVGEELMHAFQQAGKPSEPEITPALEEPKEIPEEEAVLGLPSMNKIIKNEVYDDLKKGKQVRFSTLKALAEARGVPIREAMVAAESAVVELATEIVSKGKDPRAIYSTLQSLYKKQPTLPKTSTVMKLQQYSTPPPIAYAMAHSINATEESTKAITMLEPTAGTGMLTIGIPRNVHSYLVELDEKRADALYEVFGQGLEKDFLETKTDPKYYDLVITNPPFGPLKPAQKIHGYTISKLDHAIVMKAMDQLKDDGRAAIILGANLTPGEIRRPDRIFMNWLHSNYNVVDNFEVSGKLYAGQGAKWPIRIIVVNGRQKSDNVAPVEVERVNSFEDLWNRSEEIRNVIAQGREPLDTARKRKQYAVSRAGPERKAEGLGKLPEPTQREGEEVVERVEPGAPARGVVGGERERLRGVEPGGPGRAAVPSPREREAEPIVERGAEVLPEKAKPAKTVEFESEEQAPQVAVEKATEARGGRAGSRGLRARDDVKQVETEHQVSYRPVSSGSTLGAMIPKHLAGPTKAAIEQIESKTGSIDEYVREKLRYKNLKDLKEVLSAEQVEGVAVLIHQLESGNAAVIGDQTGMGKGRIGASMIRYALINGKIPVYVTANADLFSSVYRDLVDIRNPDISPFTMGQRDRTPIVDINDNVLFQAIPRPDQVDFMNRNKSGELKLGDYDVIMMTYSQINKVGNIQQQFIENVSRKGALFILDESHKASGQSTTGAFFRGGGMVKKVEGEWQKLEFPGVINPPSQVVYMSATWVKRPDSIPVYHRTDLGKATDDMDALVEVMDLGGTPIIQVVSSQLAKNGQYMRREQSFKGISMPIKVDTTHEVEQAKVVDRVTDILQQIVQFDYEKMDHIIKPMDKEAKAYGREVTGSKNVASGVKSALFSSRFHNVIGQLMLSTKVENAITEAIDAVKNKNQKPFIVVEFTNESLLKDIVARDELVIGDGIDERFNNILHRALESTLKVTEINPYGDSTSRILTIQELGDFARVYLDIQKQIDRLDIPLRGSPIDYMISRLKAEGIKVGEITGRTIIVDYNYDKGTGKWNGIYRRRTAQEKVKTRIANAYNQGKLDAVIANISAAEGFDAHSSSKFKDQRQRVQILVQPPREINAFMQIQGRINRVGQVNLPQYTFLWTALPTERRPAAVLARKLESLNANVAADAESAMSMKEVVNMFNKYGDEVAAEWLIENRSLMKLFNLEKDITEWSSPPGKVSAEPGLMLKFTGKLTLLPVQEQSQVLDELEERYIQYIDYLDETGQNDLRVEALDWSAETTDTKVIDKGTDQSNSFTSAINLEKISIKESRKPPTFQEAAVMVSDVVEVEKKADYVKSIVDTINKEYEEWKKEQLAEIQQIKDERSRLERKSMLEERLVSADQLFKKTKNLLFIYSPHDYFNISTAGEEYAAIVQEIVVGKRREGINPGIPSRFRIRFVVNDPIRKITVPLSKLMTGGVDARESYSWGVENDFKRAQDLEFRTRRQVITGNIVRGMDVAGRGRIVAYTTDAGPTKIGILLPRDWQESDLKKDPRLELISKDAAKYFMDHNQYVTISTKGGFKINNSAGYYTLTAPGGKQRGGRYFLSDEIINEVGEFVKIGNRMEVKSYDSNKVHNVIDIIYDNFRERLSGHKLNTENIKLANEHEPDTDHGVELGFLGMTPENFKSFAKLFQTNRSHNAYLRMISSDNPKYEDLFIQDRASMGNPVSWILNLRDRYKTSLVLTPPDVRLKKHQLPEDSPISLNEINDEFRKIRDVQKFARKESVRLMEKILKPLRDSRDLAIFERIVITRDLIATVKEGLVVPNELTLGELEKELNTLEDFAPDRVIDAADNHSVLMKRHGMQLVKRGKIETPREDYFPHFVMEYYRDFNKVSSTGPRLRDPYRPYTRRREGSDKPIKTDYVNTMLEHLTKYLADNMIDDFNAKMLNSLDIYPRLIQEVMDELDVGKRLATKKVKVPPGYAKYQPVPGNYFYTGNLVGDKILNTSTEDFFDDLADMMNTVDPEKIPPNVRDLVKAREGLAVGQKRKTYIIPSTLAKHFTQYRKYEQLGPFLRLMQDLVMAWKWNVLVLNPKYQIKNIMGDNLNLFFDDTMAFMRHPQAMGMLLKRFLVKFGAKGRWLEEKELSDKIQRLVRNNNLKAKTYIELAEELAVIDSGFVGVEIAEILRLPEFKRFSKNYFEKGKVALKSIPLALREISVVRENWARLAKFLTDLKRIERGKRRLTTDQMVQNVIRRALSLEPIIPSVVRTRTTTLEGLDQISSAAKASRRALLDYGDFSRIEDKYVRRFLYPFWAWAKGNVIIQANKLWRSPLNYFFKLGSIYYLMYLWNNSDEEKKRFEGRLPDWAKYMPHLNIKIAGKMRALLIDAPWSDAASRLGLSSLAKFLSLNLKMDPVQALNESLEDIYREWGSGLNPFILELIEQRTGIDVFTGYRWKPYKRKSESEEAYARRLMEARKEKVFDLIRAYAAIQRIKRAKERGRGAIEEFLPIRSFPENRLNPAFRKPKRETRTVRFH